LGTDDAEKRIISGMRPCGRLHLGHYHGLLQRWIKLQHEYECFFFVADLPAVPGHHDQTLQLEDRVVEMVIDWLAVGVNPGNVCLFVQSRVPALAELHLLLSMITPLSWLERVPSWKERLEKSARQASEKEYHSYGQLGAPLLQCADILLYNAGKVLVEPDQEPHVELAREVARRFNYLYGRDKGFADKVKAAKRQMNRKTTKLYDALRKAYLETGDLQARETAQALLQEQQTISLRDRERLLGHLEGTGRAILHEPQCLDRVSRALPGLDGKRMSRQQDNTIWLREDPDLVVQKIQKMPTDPARVKRKDPGNPQCCPVWPLHQVYSGKSTLKWVKQGCRSAGIGCLECKKPLAERIVAFQEPVRERAREFEENPDLVRSILAEGVEQASDLASENLDSIREAMGLQYRYR
jgi:tryptophanyl-tRNA synthetase